MIELLVAGLLLQSAACSLSTEPLEVNGVCTDMVVVCQPFQISGPSSTKFDIVFVGEGFTKSTEDVLLFDQKVNKAIAYLSLPPFARWAFNFYRVRLVSDESGSDHPLDNPPACKDTPLNSHFGDPSPGSAYHHEWFLMVDEDSARVAAECATENYDLIVVLVNDGAYGGLHRSSSAVLTVSIGEGFEHVLLHEMAHGFAGLGDEYGDLVPDRHLCCPTEGHWADFPNTSIETERESLKWPVDALVPIPTDLDALRLRFRGRPDTELKRITGLWEGAAMFDSCVYRPQFACKMREEKESFCGVCRAAIASIVCTRCLDITIFDMSAARKPLRCRAGGIVRIPLPASLAELASLDGGDQQQSGLSNAGAARVDIGPLPGVETITVVEVDDQGQRTVATAHASPRNLSSGADSGPMFSVTFEIEPYAFYYVEFISCVCRDRYFGFSIHLFVNGQEIPWT